MSLDEETNPSIVKKQHRSNICRKTGKCDRCPMHDGENRKRTPKDDKHKNKDRKKPDTVEVT